MYSTIDVPVRGGTLRCGVWGSGGPLVVAAHGITSSHQAWALAGADLGRDHRFVGLDLRGRGGSRDLPGPYGMAEHAADVAAVAAHLGDPDPVVVGHSMGAFVAVAAVRAGTGSRAVLVDGGPPLPLPPGLSPDASEPELAAAIQALVGPAFPRLSMTFPTREAYRDYWRVHPSLTEWTDAVAAYVDYDLVGEAPELRPACRLDAATRDAQELYATGGAKPGPLPVPAIFLRAERGMMNEPDRPFYAEGYATEWFPGIDERTVEGTNHYTITLGAAGAGAVAGAVRYGS